MANGVSARTDPVNIFLDYVDIWICLLKAAQRWDSYNCGRLISLTGKKKKRSFELRIEKQ